MTDFFDITAKDSEFDLEQNLVELGDDVNILAKDRTLKEIAVGAGWKLNSYDGGMDIDLSAILIDKNNMTINDEDFVFYNNMEAHNGTIKYKGDSRTGAGEGDDETIFINLENVSYDILKILFTISVYKGEEQNQSLSSLKDAYIRIVNTHNDHEILRYPFGEILNDKNEAAMVVASLNREGPKWHFTPIAEFVSGGLGAIASRHGLIIMQQ